MLLEKIIFSKTRVPVLNAALDVTQLRQRVISDNIANISTQGYRRKSVRFQEYLDSFVRKPPVEGTRSDSRHLTIPRPMERPEVYEPESGLNDSGLNNVDIDREMADLAENHLFFNVSAKLINNQFSTLRRSINGRPQ